MITKSNASQTEMGFYVFFVILCQMLQMEIVAKVHHKRSQHAVEHRWTNTRLLTKISSVFRILEIRHSHLYTGLESKNGDSASDTASIGHFVVGYDVL